MSLHHTYRYVNNCSECGTFIVCVPWMLSKVIIMYKLKKSKPASSTAVKCRQLALVPSGELWVSKEQHRVTVGQPRCRCNDASQVHWHQPAVNQTHRRHAVDIHRALGQFDMTTTMILPDSVKNHTWLTGWQYITLTSLPKHQLQLNMGLVHRTVCPLMPQILLVLTVPTHKGWPGWIDPGGWLYTEMVCPAKVGHPSQ